MNKSVLQVYKNELEVSYLLNDNITVIHDKLNRGSSVWEETKNTFFQVISVL